MINSEFPYDQPVDLLGLADENLQTRGFLSKPTFKRDSLFREDLNEFVGKYAEGKARFLKDHIEECINLFNKDKELFFESISAFSRKMYGIDKEENTDEEFKN